MENGILQFHKDRNYGGLDLSAGDQHEYKKTVPVCWIGISAGAEREFK